MQTLAEIRELLTVRGLAPRKSLGQNFLIDHNLIRKLVDASGVVTGDLVLEVGPGTGTMTEELLDRGCVVVACELDRGLAQLLRERLAPRYPGFTLIEGDALETKRSLNAEVRGALGDRAFRLVANLPYGAATPLVSTLLIEHPECGSMWVTVQKEVAQRFGAPPGGKDYGLLSVLVQAACRVIPVTTLPPECFWPRPDVTSAMVGLVRRDRPLTDDLRGLADACQTVFGQRRKQLGSILGRDFAFPDGVTPMSRAEEVSVEGLIEISRRIRSDGGSRAGVR